MRLLPVVLVLSLFALPLLAVDIDPPAPTSDTPVTIRVQAVVTCPPPPQIVRSGNRFSITIDPGPCLSPPVLATFSFPLGTLPPGDYEVVLGGGINRGDYGTFYVRDANPGVVVFSPSVGPTTGGTAVILYSDVVGCFSNDLTACPLPVVTFNGVPATVVKEKFAQGSLVAIAPPNVKGVAEVTVTGTRGTKSGRVFRYYDPNDAPAATMFERVLVPVWSFGPGAFGSNWTTELTLANGSAFDYEPYRRSPLPLVARGTTTLDFGPSRPGGVLFFPPRDVAAQSRFGSLVRDTSRQAEDWGTEVRVVHESELRTGVFSLLNVPADPRFRLALRIFDADSVDSFAYVTLYPMNGLASLGNPHAIRLHSATPCKRFEPCASDDPAFAMVDLLALFPEAAGQQRLRVDITPIDPGQRLWAFVTVTNNQTQHVTVITPQ